MTEEEKFCKFFTGYFGEKTDNINQITQSCFSGKELLEFCEEYGKIKEREHQEKINLLTVERNSALQSQKDSFEEQDKQIQSLKEDKKLHIQDFERQRKAIIELEDEVSRLKGKVKEAEEGFNKIQEHQMNYCELARTTEVYKISEETKNILSNENLIKNE